MTSALVPIAMMDDVVAMIIFFSVNSFILSLGTGGSTPILAVVFLSIFLPVLIGMVIGFGAKFIYQKINQKYMGLLTVCVIGVTFGIAYFVDNVILSALPSVYAGGDGDHAPSQIWCQSIPSSSLPLCDATIWHRLHCDDYESGRTAGFYSLWVLAR